jgi:hypothetical protein
MAQSRVNTPYGLDEPSMEDKEIHRVQRGQLEALTHMQYAHEQAEVCVCGSELRHHSGWDNHAFVSMVDYYGRGHT